MKKVLVFGAGRVAKPCIDYLLRDKDIFVTVVDVDKEAVARVSEGRANTTGLVRNVGLEAKAVIEEIKPDILINLLPPALMVPVAALCVEAGVNYVNPSYIKDDMKALDQKAREAGVLLLCELGLDPGIDHMSAARKISEIHDKGGVVESFWSCCGALPSLRDNNNPFGYKLSWAPSSLIGASKRTARILVDGEPLVMPDGETFRHPHLVEIEGLGCFEEYANSDSLPYVELYGMPEVRNVYRGTFRYVGWSETIVKMNEMGLFEEGKMDLKELTYRDITAKLVGARKGDNVEESLQRFLGRESYSQVFLKLKWLGLLDDRKVPFETGSPRDIVTRLYSEKLVFEDDEQDMVIMEHRYVAKMPGKECRTLFKSTLVDFGVPGGDSSISRTTGIPPAIGAMLVLDGEIDLRGVQAPVKPEIYEPSLALLEQEGVCFRESETAI